MGAIVDRRVGGASAAERAMEEHGGVLRLTPTWVPRSFCIPGRRIRLHPDDYFALGGARGGIDERWLSSAIRAENGPLTAEHEGISFVVAPDGEFVPLDAAVEHLGASLIGSRLWAEYGKWPIYSKFFDNRDRLPFHIHLKQEHAELVGSVGKPEAYYFSPQMNNYGANHPLTYFGLNPGTTQEQFREAIANFASGDNHIVTLSEAQLIRVGTGWDVPAGVMHAPSSYCTYEPQAAADNYAMCEPWTGAAVVPEELLWKDIPAEQHGNADFLVAILDWELNVDPEFVQHRFMAPVVATSDGAHVESWVVYRSAAFSAKELTVFPGESVTVKDAAAYGLIAVQGHGRLGDWPIESPTLIRFGQLTSDEFFVSERAAKDGVRVVNESSVESLVMLKHFGPQNPENNRVG
jgi:hypothetical protein